MTIIFLQTDGVPITAQAERQGSAALYGGGANRPLGGRSGFRVDTPADVLTVTTSAWTLKPCSAMIDPGASTHQGMYGWASDANITGTPTPPDATLPRKDIYYIRVNDSTAGDGSGAVSAPVLYLAGTPNANPSAPALPARSFLIATVTVPQVGGGNPTVVLNPARFVAAGGILPVYSQAERDGLNKYVTLTVSRADVGGLHETWDGTAWSRGIQHAEFTGATAPTGGAQWGTGPLSLDSAMSRNGGIFTSPANDKIMLPGPGLYSVSARVQLSVNATGTTWVSLVNDTNTSTYVSYDIQPGNASGGVSIANLYVPATQNIRIVFYSTTATGYTLTSRVRVSRIG